MGLSLKMALLVAAGLSIASMLSAGMITEYDMPYPKAIFRDVDNDGFVDLVEEGKEVFWNQGNDEFCNNQMELRNLHPAQQGFWIQTDEGYWVRNHSFEPSNSTVQETKPPVLALNTIKIESGRCIMIDIITQNVTIYRNDGQGTFVPVKMLNPTSEFNPILQMIPDKHLIL